MRARGSLFTGLVVLLAVTVLAVAFGAAGASGAVPRFLIFPDPAPAPAPAPAPDPAPAPAPAPAPTPARDPDPGSPVEQPCFGAAAVDPLHPCENPGLSLTVFPAPANARAAQHSRGCDHREVAGGGLLDICFFGAKAAAATRTVALLGDSHAAHWRAALDTVLTAHRWRAISIQRAGCPLTLAHPNLPGLARQAGCMDWNRAVLRWMGTHPEIDVVFTSQHRGSVLSPRPGVTPGTARLAGYVQSWTTLLGGGVKHIVVIRDTPRASTQTLPCIARAVAAHQSAGEVCALPTSFALRSDPAVDAARRFGSPQVQVADLATFFCRRRMCPPVTGGALILRDVSHMTTTYSTTLGPYLLRKVDELMQSWPAPAEPAPADASAPATR